MNKLQVYTYQRAADEISFNQRAKRRQTKKSSETWNPKLYIKGLENFDIIAFLKTWATVENLLFVVGALILSRAFVLRELLPFVYAYIVGFGHRDKTRLMVLSFFAILGLFTVLNGFELWVNIITIAVLTAVINYTEVPKGKAWWGIPLLTLSIIMISKSLLMLMDQVSFYTEMVIVFESFLAAILTLVFMVSSNALHWKKSLDKYTFEEITAFIVLGLGIVMGLNEVYLFSLSISSIICRLGILMAALLWGSGGGTMVGVMCGIIPAISSSIFAQSLGMYAISGLLAGLFKNLGRLGVIIGFMLGNLALSIFVTDISAIIISMWETAIACLIFFILPASLKEKIPVQSLGPISNLRNKEVKIMNSHLQESVRNSMENLALVFAELSSTFTETESIQNRYKETAYLNYLYEEISNHFCYHCSRYESCWGQDFYATSQEILDIFAVAEQKGGAALEENPPEFIRRCLYGKEMINAINYLFDNLRTNEYWAERLDKSRQLVSRQLIGVSKVIKNLAEGIDDKTVIDLEMRDKLLKECLRLNLNITDLTPIKTGGGQMYLKIVTPSCNGQSDCERDLAMVISSLLGDRMEVYEKKCPGFIGKGHCEFTLTRSFNYKVETGVAQAGKEKICGDSFTIATLKEGQELIALSDGMGVGQKAYNESQAAVRLLENLLNCGYDKNMALETINSVLLLRSSTESFTTLDMVMVDLYTAEVDFIKIGSAPSFIKRGKKVGVVTSNSLPIGILDSLDMSSEKRALCPRDLLIIVSDGILEIGRSETDDTWLRDFLIDIDENNPQIVAEMIINQALNLSQGNPADDMTAIVMYIDFNL
ncbi:MAG: stage II sporulation protein E [Syntrophomonadaceae bacterium]|nr:stage II sporulation protein E [Syntrophomonadaceae bacterium]